MMNDERMGKKSRPVAIPPSQLKPPALQKIKKGTRHSSGGLGLNDGCLGGLGVFAIIIIPIICFIVCCGILGG